MVWRDYTACRCELFALTYFVCFFFLSCGGIFIGDGVYGGGVEVISIVWCHMWCFVSVSLEWWWNVGNGVINLADSRTNLFFKEGDDVMNRGRASLLIHSSVELNVER